MRPEQAEISRLAWAFAISLAFHLLVWGGYQTGRKYNVWQNLHFPAWVHAPQFLKELRLALTAADDNRGLGLPQ